MEKSNTIVCSRTTLGSLRADVQLLTTASRKQLLLAQQLLRQRDDLKIREVDFQVTDGPEPRVHFWLQCGIYAEEYQEHHILFFMQNTFENLLGIRCSFDCSLLRKKAA